MENTNKSRNSNILKTIIQLVIGIGIVCVIFSHFQNELKNLDLKKVKGLIENLGELKFYAIILLGVIGMAILSLYDFFVLRAIPMYNNLKSFRIFKISFMTNSLNMILGFGGFIGAGLRYYLYRPYAKDKSKLIVAIGMILISMLSGISLLSIFVVLKMIPGEVLYSDNKTFYYLLIVMSFFLPIYLLINMRNPKIKSDKYLAIKLALISFFEWIYAAFLVLFILYIFVGDFINGKELKIVGIIVVASIAGLLSMVPGGMGAFDVLVIVGLKRLGFNDEIVVATIFLYRLSYYIIPFVLGFILLIAEIVKTCYKKILNKKEGM